MTTAGDRSDTARKHAAPGPGSWMLDVAHFDRPFTRAIKDILCPAWDEGQAASLVANGVLLEKLDYGFVDEFFYIQVRPLGAPKGGMSRRAPPKIVFQALCALHPELRKRIRTARHVWDSRRWCQDLESWTHVQKPAFLARLEGIQKVTLRTLDDAALADHVDDVVKAARATMTAHFRYSGATMIPVGAFIALATRETGARVADLMQLFNGTGAGEADRDLLTAAQRALDGASLRSLLDAEDPAAVIDTLARTEGDSTSPLREWLSKKLGSQVITGDLDNPIGEEMPHLLVDELRAPPRPPAPPPDLESFLSAAPPSSRETLTTLLADARLCYRIRDERCAVIDARSLGLVRRALMESGRRLRERGVLKRPAHAIECAPADVAQALRGIVDVDGEAAEARALHRARASIDDMPETLGERAPPAPPTSWLPRGAREINEAMLMYIDLMDRENAQPTDDKRVRGFAASPGRHVGIARQVCSPDEMGKVKRGDVLVARCTMPTYNAMFALAGGVATDRGGILSHAAIVSRELGIPGVVGCRDATRRIPDGARVLIDGDAGTVEVVS
jgi:phosphohistidine swiveling domain-containing protein